MTSKGGGGGEAGGDKLGKASMTSKGEGGEGWW